MKTTADQLETLGYMMRSPSRSREYFPHSLRRCLPQLVKKGLATIARGDAYDRPANRTYRATEAGKALVAAQWSQAGA